MALRDDRHDVERLFTLLVETVAAQDAARLSRPIQVSEIYQQLVPYRRCRERIGIDTNEDYEMAVLRLLAGEGGFAAARPEEARQMMADEVASPNPDPLIVREFAAAHAILDSAAVRRVRGRSSGYSQEREIEPEPDPEPELPFALESADPTPPSTVQGGTCKSCGRTLPLHRAVTFCPFCGQAAGVRACVQCGDALENGWRFCVACGTPSAR